MRSNLPLSVQEEVVLARLVSHIIVGSQPKQDAGSTTPPNPAHIDKVLHAFLDYSIDHFAKFHKNAVIQEFCSTNPKALKIVSDALKKARYPHVTIYSKEDKEEHPLSDQLRSYTLLTLRFSEKRSSKNLEEYNKLWSELKELGCYHCLILSCKNQLVILLDDKTPKDKVELSIQLIEKDTDRLANLYGGLGYIMKGIFLFELHLYFKNINHEDTTLSTQYLYQGIENILCAAALDHDKYSTQLIDSITKGEGVKSLFDEYSTQYDFKDWPSLCNTFKEAIGEPHFKSLNKSALAKIKLDLKRPTPAEEKLTASPKQGK